jgi:hypothetical protein
MKLIVDFDSDASGKHHRYTAQRVDKTGEVIETQHVDSMGAIEAILHFNMHMERMPGDRLKIWRV